MNWKLTLTLSALALTAWACEDNSACLCDDIEISIEDAKCDRCVCEGGSVRVGLGPKGVETEADCAKTEDCAGSNVECIDGKCVNNDPDNANRFRACVDSSSRVEGPYIKWNGDQKKIIECNYRDGKRDGVCVVFDPSGSVIMQCGYASGRFTNTFTYGVCKEVCDDQPESLTVTISGTSINDEFPENGCSEDSAMSAEDADASTEADGDTVEGDASMEADGDTVEGDAATEADAVEADASTEEDATLEDASDEDAMEADASIEEDATLEDASDEDAVGADATDEDAATDADDASEN